MRVPGLPPSSAQMGTRMARPPTPPTPAGTRVAPIPPAPSVSEDTRVPGRVPHLGSRAAGSAAGRDAPAFTWGSAPAAAYKSAKRDGAARAADAAAAAGR